MNELKGTIEQQKLMANIKEIIVKGEIITAGDKGAVLVSNADGGIEWGFIRCQWWEDANGNPTLLTRILDANGKEIAYSTSLVLMANIVTPGLMSPKDYKKLRDLPTNEVLKETYLQKLDAEKAGKLVYVGSDGDLTELELGDGLEIIDGKLCLST